MLDLDKSFNFLMQNGSLKSHNILIGIILLLTHAHISAIYKIYTHATTKLTAQKDIKNWMIGLLRLKTVKNFFFLSVLFSTDMM